MQLDSRINCSGALTALTPDASLGLSPQTVNNGNATSGYMDMAKYARLCVIVNCGVIAAGGVVTWTILEATNAGGGGAQTLTGYTTGHTDVQDNMSAIIDIPAIALSAGFTHLAVHCVESGVQNALCSAVLLGYQARLASDPMVS